MTERIDADRRQVLRGIYGVVHVKTSEDEYAARAWHRVERAFHRRAKELGYGVRKVEPPAPADVAG